jgi:hypothetical protein
LKCPKPALLAIHGFPWRDLIHDYDFSEKAPSLSRDATSGKAAKINAERRRILIIGFDFDDLGPAGVGLTLIDPNPATASPDSTA